MVVAAPTTTVTEERTRSLEALYASTSFIGSLLLFSIQPLAAKMLLPLVGGSSALWSTALAFFQFTLLIGYLAAHGSTTRLGPRRHPTFHVALIALPLFLLPIAVPEALALKTNWNPTLWVLLLLTVMVGAPFFALSTSSSTLQRWFSWSGAPNAEDPYFLYSAGNIGSVAALVGYPVLIEPNLAIRDQTIAWALFYGAFVLLTAAAAVTVDRQKPSSSQVIGTPSEVPSNRRSANWLFHAAVPTALLVAVTSYLSIDLAPFPLLWIVPLLMYLITFVLVFKRGRRVGTARLRVWVIATGPAVAIAAIAGTAGAVPLWVPMAACLAWFFAATLVIHDRLAADRPPADQLTRYFAIISLGGAIGGSVVSFLAPQIFLFNAEFPLAVGAAMLLIRGEERPILGRVPAWLGWLVVTAVVIGAMSSPADTAVALFFLAAIVGVVLVGRTTSWATLTVVIFLLPVALQTADEVLDRSRSFYGYYAVVDDGTRRDIVSGTTVHGRQLNEEPLTPTSYYVPQGPVGDILGERSGPRSIGIVGLGAGSLAAYGQPGDEIVFYEIDEAVVRIASNPDLFTFLSTTPADVSVEVGDGRHLLGELAPQHDILVLDAFTSDAVPTHLLTVEAMLQYRSSIADNGIVLMNISNRHLDLEPIISATAAQAGFSSVFRSFDPDGAELEAGATAAIWIAFSSQERLADLDGWQEGTNGGEPWTDDFSDILAAINW